MNELCLPQSDDELTKRLKDLHEARKTEQARRKQKEKEQERRRQLTADERNQVFSKTGGHCHLCGGEMNQSSGGELTEEREVLPHFVVDHIVPFASGGKDSLDNFLAAHGLCNGCRWFYSPEEFQWILRIGIWARKQMEDAKTDIGQGYARTVSRERGGSEGTAKEARAIALSYPSALTWAGSCKKRKDGQPQWEWCTQRSPTVGHPTTKRVALTTMVEKAV
jgi:5-methylcytosine-specific restriction endonuclease McrA